MHIKTSETIASFKNQVKKEDIESLLRNVTCVTLRVRGQAGFPSLGS